MTSRRIAAVLNSPAAADVRKNRDVLIFVFGLLLVVAYVLTTGGEFLTWHGSESIPCGDYCGTDAGLITSPAAP